MADIPDYAGLMSQQSAQDLAYLNQQTQANRPNQYNPYGSSTWTNNNGQWTNTVSLSPQQQQLFNQQQGLMGTYMNQAQGNAGIDLNQYVNQANATSPDAAIKALMDRMQPYLDQTGNQLQSKLAAQGLTQGSDAYNNAYQQYNQQVNDARLGAITQGYQTQGTMIDNILKQYQLANSAKNAPLNSMGALASGGQVQSPQFSGFSQAGAASAPDLASAYGTSYNQNVAANNMNTAKTSSLLGGIGSVVGGLLGGTGGSNIGSGLGGFLGGLF